MAEAVRLQRFLASAGVAARRKAEMMISAGRVTVNGEIVRVLGTKVDPANDSVTVDGEAVVALDYFYVLLNKPKACITAVTDDRGRPTVMDYLPNVPVPVKPVGRLDFYTEGVLLLTNDGELAARLLAPANHVAKTYHAKVHGQVSPEQLSRLRAGIQLEDGMVTQPAEVALLPSDSKHSWVAVTIFEGKYHQVHRMFEALGFRVDKLQRVAFANLTFHHLRIGDARELNQQELNALRDMVGLDHGPVARGRWRSAREDTDIRRRARAMVREEADAAAAAGAAPAGARDDHPDDRTAAPTTFRESSTRTFARADTRGPARDSRSPSSPSSRTSRDASRNDRRPGRDERRPARADSRGPARDTRSPASRDDRRTSSGSRTSFGTRSGRATDSRAGSKPARTGERSERRGPPDRTNARAEERGGRPDRTERPGAAKRGQGRSSGKRPSSSSTRRTR